MMRTRNAKLRLALLFSFFLVGYALLLARLFIMQVAEHSFFANLGQQQWSITVTQLPRRAEIYDRTGRPLALNKDSLAAFIIPSTLKNKKKVHSLLKKYFPTAHERLKKNPESHFLYLKRRLCPEDKEFLESLNLEDIHFLKEPSRYYPLAGIGPIIGITDIDNHGLFGIELLCDKRLSGQPTTVVLEKDARSGQFYFTKETKEAGTEGKPVRLTIDGDLQFLAYEKLKQHVHEIGATEGSVIIMDPSNGHILAMTNYPDFDPQETQALDQEKTKNKIVTECYEFGSVMKAFLAFAALEEGVVTPDEIIDCENKKVGYLDGIKFSTWQAHGLLPFSDVIVLSNNFGTSKIAKRLGSKLYDHYQRCGFGKKTGVFFLGEQSGFINPPQQWSRQSIFSLSFGYEISATLLQLATAFCMIANNGYPIRPVVCLEPQEQPQLVHQKPLYSQETHEAMRSILQRTITEGTAHRAKLAGYTVLGKTGTANLLVDGKYRKERNIYTFAAIIEKDSYKRVIVTFIKETTRKNVYASSIAVPLFNAIAQEMLIHDKVV